MLQNEFKNLFPSVILGVHGCVCFFFGLLFYRQKDQITENKPKQRKKIMTFSNSNFKPNKTKTEFELDRKFAICNLKKKKD